MLSERSYLRDPYEGRNTSPLTWLLCALTAGFAVQMLLTRFGADEMVLRGLVLTPAGLRAGYLWTPLTCSFLQGGLLELLCILVSLYFLGRELLPIMGKRHFLGLYGGSVVFGGLCWAAVNWKHGGALMGATAGVDALLMLYACLFPNQEITFLLFFILPVRIKPKYLVAAVVGIDLFGCALYEVAGMPSRLGWAHSAHLGGLAAGWIYYRIFRDGEPRRPEIELPQWLKRAPRVAAAVTAAARPFETGDRASLRAEVDRILDKINSEGFGALTREERRRLDEARELMGGKR